MLMLFMSEGCVLKLCDFEVAHMKYRMFTLSACTHIAHINDVLLTQNFAR